MKACAVLLLSTLAAPLATGAAAPAAAPVQQVSADAIARTVEAELRARLQATGRTQASVKVSGRIDDQTVPAGAHQSLANVPWDVPPRASPWLRRRST